MLPARPGAAGPRADDVDFGAGGRAVRDQGRQGGRVYGDCAGNDALAREAAGGWGGLDRGGPAQYLGQGCCGRAGPDRGQQCVSVAFE